MKLKKGQFLTSGQVANRFGCKIYHVHRIFDMGMLPQPPRVGKQRVIDPELLPLIRESLLKAGYRVHDEAAKAEEAAHAKAAALRKRVHNPSQALWDAIVAVTGHDVRTMAGNAEVARAKNVLASALPPFTADDVFALPAVLATRPDFAGRALTLEELVGNIGLVRA